MFVWIVNFLYALPNTRVVLHKCWSQAENMRKSLILLIAVTTMLFSCGQESKSTADILTKDIETSKTTENVDSQKSVQISIDKYIDTRYAYADSNGKHLIIENSLPKGGLKYTDSTGKEYIYAVFWTRIANETATPFELSIDIPAYSFELPSSPGNLFKIVLPSEKMTLDQAPLFNYGLKGLNDNFGNKLQHLSSLHRTIHSKDTSLFYVVVLSEQGLEGTLRAGFSMKDDKLYYKVNDKEIYCGQVTIENLKLQK
jgi:hypothetical protein